METRNQSKKVIAYARASIHSNAETAVKEQMMRVQEYCEVKGYHVSATVCDIGDRKMGFNMLQEALKFAAENGTRSVVMDTTKRLFAETSELEPVQQLLGKTGVEIETMDRSHEVLADATTLDFIMNIGLLNEGEGEDDGIS